MDFLSGLLGGLNGLSGLANAYQYSPDDNWLKKLFSSSAGGTGQTMVDENLLRNYFNYAPTSTDPSTLPAPKTGMSTADENLLRSYFGYGQAQPTQDDNAYLKKALQGLGGLGGGGSSKSSSGSSGSEATKLSTGGGMGQNSKHDYSGLISGLWRPVSQASSPFTNGIGIDPTTGLISFGR